MFRGSVFFLIGHTSIISKMLLHLFPRSVITRNFTNSANCQIICISPVSSGQQAGLLGGLALIKSASARTFLRLQSRSRLLSVVSGLFPPSLPPSVCWGTAWLLIREQPWLGAAAAALPVGSERQQRHFSSAFSDVVRAGRGFSPWGDSSPPSGLDSNGMRDTPCCSGSQWNCFSLLLFSLLPLQRFWLLSALLGFKHGSPSVFAALAVLFKVDFCYRRLGGEGLWGQLGRVLRANPRGADSGDAERRPPWVPTQNGRGPDDVRARQHLQR